MLSPTTENALDVSATVLRRQTTRMNAFRGGFEAALGRQTTLNADLRLAVDRVRQRQRADQPHPAQRRAAAGRTLARRHRRTAPPHHPACLDRRRLRDPARHRRQRHRDLRRAERAGRVADRAGPVGDGLARLRSRLADGGPRRVQRQRARGRRGPRLGGPPQRRDAALRAHLPAVVRLRRHVPERGAARLAAHVVHPLAAVVGQRHASPTTIRSSPAIRRCGRSRRARRWAGSSSAACGSTRSWSTARRTRGWPAATCCGRAAGVQATVSQTVRATQ